MDCDKDSDYNRKVSRHITKGYNKDHILDNLDIKASIEKNKYIPKINEDIFIYKKQKKDSTKKSQKHNLIWKDILFELDNLKQIHATDYFCDFFPIGEGAFSTVYSAFDKKLSKKVAIKVNSYKLNER